MTIEIHKPELEALILERLRSGAFESIEDILMQALLMQAIQGSAPQEKETRTGAHLAAAMQASPCKDIDLEPAKFTIACLRQPPLIL